MPSCSVQMFRDEKSVLNLVGFILIVYFFSMDIKLYLALQSTTLTSQVQILNQQYSPFHPLSVKLVMSDPTSHYIFNPLAEYFDDWTNFSTVFYFITPNMISLAHVIIALLAAKLVSSEVLSVRRWGVVLYEFRSVLDCLDGVVYRSRVGKHFVYHSERSTFGHFVDVTCDCTGGVILCFGVLFYLFKYHKISSSSGGKDLIPTWIKDQKGLTNGHHLGTNLPQQSLTKRYVFFKMLIYGLSIAAASGSWDHIVDMLRKVFETKIANPHLEALQTSYLHSLSFWILVWIWRICEGQALMQYLLIAVFIDKVWEFVNFFQYLNWTVVLCLYAISHIYVSHLQAILFL